MAYEGLLVLVHELEVTAPSEGKALPARHGILTERYEKVCNIEQHNTNVLVTDTSARETQY
jgi:hypothetical protein